VLSESQHQDFQYIIILW